MKSWRNWFVMSRSWPVENCKLDFFQRRPSPCQAFPTWAVDLSTSSMVTVGLFSNYCSLCTRFRQTCPALHFSAPLSHLHDTVGEGNGFYSIHCLKMPHFSDFFFFLVKKKKKALNYIHSILPFTTRLLVLKIKCIKICVWHNKERKCWSCVNTSERHCV